MLVIGAQGALLASLQCSESSDIYLKCLAAPDYDVCIRLNNTGRNNAIASSKDASTYSSYYFMMLLRH